jgi:hypothetical protein
MVGFGISSKSIELFGCAIVVLVQSLNASESFLTSFRDKSVKPFMLRSCLTTGCSVAFRQLTKGWMSGIQIPTAQLVYSLYNHVCDSLLTSHPLNIGGFPPTLKHTDHLHAVLTFRFIEFYDHATYTPLWFGGEA